MTKKVEGFKDVPGQVSFPGLEGELIGYWKANKIFEKSVEQRPENKRWTFLDGPPFVTGMPHYGSLLSSLPKDLFGRYWTMKGYRVRRVWGWDGHGLPIENKVEGKLKIKRKKDIEDKVGVKKFIQECLTYVDEVSDEWEWYVDHVGRWADFENAYKTWDKDYMESVMWVFKQMYDKGYIYKGLRVSLYCPHCCTPISNFEVAMDANENYKEVKEASNTYKYKLKGEDNTYILAWSTTPWNKIVTPALAINPKLQYIKVEQAGEFYILAEETKGMLKEIPYTVVKIFSGAELVGREFEGHYDFFEIEEGKKAFVIIAGEFVAADEGTGVVTIAAYGEDDLKVMNENDIQIELHVDEEGFLKSNVPNGWAGKHYLEVNPLVNQDLVDRGLMYNETAYVHRVPHCWRCHTRLMHAPQNAWYVDIDKLRPKMIALNDEVNWFPGHFKKGRFLKSVEAAPDWCISRSRYWGSPVPVWECKCGERVVPGSIGELEKLSGKKIDNLHKPEIDEVVIPCPTCHSEMKRVPEVLDSWIEAGSASFAERHYPFEGNLKLEDFYPPDFITEYTGQIRAWFYVLHVIGTALYESVAFKNVAVTGVILGTDGRKMSKNYGNYPDPKKMIETYGGDALRLYLLGSPVMHGEDIRISEQDYRVWVKNYLLTAFNCFKFFVTYANLEGWAPKERDFEFVKDTSSNILDIWIVSRLHTLIKGVTESWEKYDTVRAVANLQDFVNELSTWYVRRSRERLGNGVVDNTDRTAFFETSFYVLRTLALVSAPVTPFISEHIYRHLTGHESVHLSDFPKVNFDLINQSVENDMDLVRQIVEKGHAARKESKIGVRQPLASVRVKGSQQLEVDLEELILSELNVKSIEWIEGAELEVKLNVELTEELLAEGEARNLIRKIQIARKEAGCELSEEVILELPTWPGAWEGHIKEQTLVREIRTGEILKVIRS